MVDERWLTVQEVAARLQLGEETVRRFLRRGVLKGRAFGGRAGYRVKESDLATFLAERGEPARGTPPPDPPGDAIHSS